MTGMAAGALALPPGTRLVPFWNGAITPIPSADKRQLADAALGAARSAGASYADVRIGRYLNQFVDHPRGQGPEPHQHRVVRRRHPGHRRRHLGVRRHQRGHAGRRGPQAAAASGGDRQGQREAAGRAGAAGAAEGLRRGHAGGRRSRRTRSKCRSRRRSTCCWRVNAAAMKERRQVRQLAAVPGQRAEVLRLHRRLLHRPGHPPDLAQLPRSPPIDTATGKFQTRDALSAPMGMGWEYLGGARRRQDAARPRRDPLRHSYDMIEDAAPAGQQRAREAARAKSVDAGQVRPRARPHAPLAHHPRVGGPSARARPRARLRGQLRRHQLRHARQVAEQELQVRQPTWSTSSPTRPSPARLGAVGYDDEGVATKRWDLVKDGILVNYQTIRDQAHIIGESESARLLLRRQLELGPVPAHAQRLARARQGRS